MIPISVCIIAKNEEKNIERCLQPLKKYPFEIIVVDTGSTDRTREIAEKYADKVFDFEWVNDFSAARNYSISKASHNWILVIDCDEFLEKIDLDEIYKMMEQHPKTIGRLLRRNLTTDGGAILDYVERLFSRRYYQYSGIIHEQVVPKEKFKATITPIALTISHTGYIGNSDELNEKAQRNIDLLLVDLQNKPGDTYTLFQLGQAYFLVYDYETAFQYLKLALENDINPSMEYVKLMIVTYGYCLIHLFSPEEALSILDVYDSFSTYADFVFLIGTMYLNNNQPLQAMLQFITATTLTDFKSEGVNSFLAFHNIGSIYEQLGDKDMAVRFYKKAGNYEKSLERLRFLT